jgi:hypothetical protein
MSEEIMGSEYVPSAEELAANAALVAQAKENKERELEQVALKETALVKLAELGLTEEEARAVIGL